MAERERLADRLEPTKGRARGARPEVRKVNVGDIPTRASVEKGVFAL